MRRIGLLIFSSVLVFALSAVPAASADTYPSFDAMAKEVFDFAAKHPKLVTVSEYGKSVEGRPLLAIRIALPDGKKRAEALVAANIHGNEYIGNRMALAIAHRLVDGAESDAWIYGILDKTDFYVLPCVNPDGYVATWGERGKPAAARKVRHNAHGVDLNRNFPLPATRTMSIPMAGSLDPDSPYYMGPRPYSEPETRAVRDFVAAHRFFAAIDLHSNWGTVFPARCPDLRCVRTYNAMFKPALARQKRVYALGMAPQIDTFTGEMEDALYYDFGVLAACWEVYFLAEGKEAYDRTHDWFYESNPEDIQPWIDNDRDAILAAIEKAHELTKGEPLGVEFRNKNSSWFK